MEKLAHGKTLNRHAGLVGATGIRNRATVNVVAAWIKDLTNNSAT